MNNLIKNIFIFIILVVFVIGFSSSYTSYSIDNLAFVSAIGVDVSDDGYLRVVFQFTDISGSGSESGESSNSKSVITSVEATSIESAVSLMDAHVGKELNLSHCKLIVFSEEFARTDISAELYTLVNDVHIRPSANIVISKCDTQYYLENSTPSLENYITKYYDIFPTSGKYTGYTVNATLKDFYYSLKTQTCEPYAILGGVIEEEEDSNSSDSQKIDTLKSSQTTIQGKRKSENIGLAVFKGGTFVGELSALDTLSFSLVNNLTNNFLISIPNEETEDPSDMIDIYLNDSSNTKVDVKLVNGSPYISIKLNLVGKLVSASDKSNYNNSNYLEQLGKQTNSYLESIVSSYLYKTAKDYKSDINCFGKSSLSHFTTWDDFINYNWNDNYKNSFFNVSVDTKMKSGFILTNT